MEIKPGDWVQMKKPHPCGGYVWEILRAGMDFKIRCQTCGRIAMLPRVKLEKSIKKILDTAKTP